MRWRGCGRRGHRSKEGRKLKKDIKLVEAEIASRSKEIDLVTGAVADGSLIGLCASNEDFERKNPEISRGGTCW